MMSHLKAMTTIVNVTSPDKTSEVLIRNQIKDSKSDSHWQIHNVYVRYTCTRTLKPLKRFDVRSVAYITHKVRHTDTEAWIIKLLCRPEKDPEERLGRSGSAASANSPDSSSLIGKQREADKNLTQIDTSITQPLPWDGSAARFLLFSLKSLGDSLR